ncbi:MAG: PAS domain S-box protein [Roseiarcus sp.]
MDVAPDTDFEAAPGEALQPGPQGWSNATPAMMHMIDAEGRIVAVTDVWLARTGYAREDVLGRSSLDFLSPESRRRAIAEVLPVLSQRGHTENNEYQMICRDGRLLDILVSAVLRDRAAGAASLAVITDVTARKLAERRLAESEARYRGLVEEQSDFVSLATPDGVLTFVNHAYAQLHGAQPDELAGRSLLDFVPEDQRAAVAEHLAAVCRLDREVEVENQVRLPDGSARWVGWTNRALRDGEGKTIAIHSVGRDIDRRVAAERRLKASEAAYRLLADNSTDMILLVRRDGTRAYVSPACRALLGYEPEEMLGIGTRDSLHPDDFPKAFERLSQSRDERATLTYRMRRKDGGFVWVEAVARAIADEAGEPTQRLLVVRDIEQRLAAERLLRQSEARYRQLAEYSSDLVIQLDRDLVRNYVSPACRAMLGYEPEEMIGVKSIAMAHPDDVERLTAIFRSLLDGSAERQVAISRVQRRDGGWVWVEAQLTALRDPATGEISGIVGSLRDISQRREVEEQLAEATRRLEALAAEDGLTGLANRRAFDEALSRELGRASRDGVALGLIMIDVDRFKAFNDRYGHPAGDDCLRRISAEIRAMIRRPGDIAARYGGEEFAVLLPGADEAGATLVAGRIRRAVQMLAIEHEGGPSPVVSVSAGIAALGRLSSERDAARLLGDADRALYRAKEQGRDAAVGASSLARAREARPKAAARRRAAVAPASGRD